MNGAPHEHLAVYGTLRPGEENHWLVRSVSGVWRDGLLTGWVYVVGWGRYEGYPGLTLHPEGNRVPVAVLTSETLDRHWDELDEFEGPGYRRVRTPVDLDDGSTVTAWVYEVDPDAD